VWTSLEGELDSLTFAIDRLNCAYRFYGEETFVRSLDPGAPMRYHVISSGGTEVLRLLDRSPAKGKELARAVAPRLGLRRDECLVEVRRFLARLCRLGIVRAVDPPAEACRALEAVGAGIDADLPDAAGADTDDGFDACTYMYDVAFQKCLPFKVDIELTYRCNLRCAHCYASKDVRGELDLTRIEDVLEQLAEAGCLELVFTGGEPTLKRDFVRILETAKRLGFAITLLTNGTALTPELADALAENKPEYVSISIYGATPETHDSFTGVAGSFRRSIRGAGLVADRGVRVLCTYVLTNANVHERRQVQGLMSEIGIDYKTTPLIFPTASRDSSPLRYRLTDEQLADVMRDGTYVPVRTQCNAGRGRYRISPRGEVFPCELMRIEIGDLRSQSFHHIVARSPRLLELREVNMFEPDECRDCELKPHCPRCAGIAYLETGSLTSKFEEGCRIARTYSEVRRSQSRSRVTGRDPGARREPGLSD